MCALAGARLDVKIDGLPGPFGDQLVQVVGLGGGELPHREVVQDDHGGPASSRSVLSQLRSACPPARWASSPEQVGNRASEPRRHGQVPQGLAQVGLAGADRYPRFRLVRAVFSLVISLLRLM